MRKGNVNQNAIDFVGKVKPDHDVLSYNLTNLSDTQLIYDTAVTQVCSYLYKITSIYHKFMQTKITLMCPPVMHKSTFYLLLLEIQSI